MVGAIREMSYEETIEDIKNTCGRIPGFMNFLPREKLVRDWPSWKGVGEIDIERASGLLCTDNMFESDL
ncbi:MAG: hypothetical protein Q7R50_02660 [Dehalococcoidales bacterium]|nr:hypothetical protein [Dehalococcoidales bacterium]